jgi:hypothetical protein
MPLTTFRRGVRKGEPTKAAYLRAAEQRSMITKLYPESEPWRALIFAFGRPPRALGALL